MTIAAFLAVTALLLAHRGAGTSPRWPLAQPLAVILFSLAVCIIGFGGRIPWPY